MCYAAFVCLGVSRVNGFAVPLTGFLLNVSKPDALRGSMRAAGFQLAVGDEAADFYVPIVLVVESRLSSHALEPHVRVYIWQMVTIILKRVTTCRKDLVQIGMSGRQFERGRDGRTSASRGR